MEYNPLYADITVDYSVINDWADDFIPTELQDHIICLPSTDHDERAGYSVDLEEHDYENYWQAAEDGISDSTRSSPLVTGSFAIDINGERQNPDIRMLNSVYHHKNNVNAAIVPHDAQYMDSSSETRPIPTVKYAIHGQVTLLNHWQDASYSLSAFPTLFPAGVGGHMGDRPILVSIPAFADWALRHHSRRQASLDFHAENRLICLGLPATRHLCT
jgi:hypothetical protein